MGSTEAQYKTTPGLSIGTMTFDLGWPWTVLVWIMELETACVGQIHVQWLFRWRNRKWFRRMRVISLPFFYWFAQNVLKLWFTGEMFASYRKSGSLNPFPVTNLRPKVEFKNCTYCACADSMVAENGVACPKRPRLYGKTVHKIQTGSSNIVKTKHTQWKITKIKFLYYIGNRCRLIHFQWQLYDRK